MKTSITLALVVLLVASVVLVRAVYKKKWKQVGICAALIGLCDLFLVYYGG